MARRGPASAVSPLDDERLLHVAQNVPIGYFEADRDGCITFVSTRWCEITGAFAEMALGANWTRFVHPDDVERVQRSWCGAAQRRVPLDISYRILHGRDAVSVRTSLAPVFSTGSDIACFAGATLAANEHVATDTDIDAQTRANDNLRFILEASTLCSSNLEIDAVCTSLAELAIQRVADWCFVFLQDESGDYTTCAVAHRNPERVKLLEAFRDRYPVQNNSWLGRAVGHNAAILVSHVNDDDLASQAQDPEHLEFLRALEMRSAMLLPLATPEGCAYGGIALVSSESRRSYTAEDLEVAQMVAHRAASAIRTATAFSKERERSVRLRFVAEAGDLLVQTTDLQTALDQLSSFIVSGMADLAYVILVEGRDALRTVACAHADPEKARIAERLRGQRTLRPEAEENAIWMLSQHRTLLHRTVPLDAVLAGMWDYLAPEVRELNIQSAVTVPLYSHGETYGALVVYSCTPGRAFNEEDAELFTDLGRRVSIAIEHQRTLDRERRIAEALQQTLLPQPGMMPVADGLRFAAHYRPSKSEAHVGGDWYDAVTLPDGTILISVGDVTGRGLHAAGLMGKLRQATGMAALYERDPARILDSVDFHLRSRRSGSLATAFVGIIDPQRKTLRYAGAGHPPPLLRRNGEIFELRSGGLPLGLRDEDYQQSQEVSLDGADLLVLYTDGLTEATRDLSFGEQRLAFLVSSEAISFVRNPAEFLCDACLPSDAQDDTAVLTISFGERASWAFDAENAKAAHAARAEMVAYLSEHCAPDADLGSAELVFGELVGNVVRHAPGPIEVQIDVSGPRPVLHVIDRGRGFVRDPSLPVDILSESGRGLYIVSRLTDALRVERIAGYGNHVAAVLKL